MSTIRLSEETKERLRPYRKVYGSYEKGIIELIDYFEHLESPQ